MPTISSFDKWRSERISPVTCSKCGALSYIDQKSKAVALLGAYALGIVGLWFSAELMSLYPVALAVFIAIFWVYSIWYPALMVKTDINKIADLQIDIVAALYIVISIAVVGLIFLSVL